uniref:Uncharacterized protein n=1 Tax=Zea mays TaxID=4577 RepID=B6SPE9_MAIZE|nr:hypothetical protein [Zea mays]
MLRRAGMRCAVAGIVAATDLSSRGFEYPKNHPGNWNLKCQVKNRYHRMRRLEDAVMSS